MADLLVHFLLAILMPPLMFGIINRIKALIAGRTGPPLLQPYYDILRLLRKGTVFSTTTTWVFRAGPIVTLATLVAAALLLPFGSHAAPVSFNGDMVLFAYLLAQGRFFTTIAAMDTGSSFEGMGSVREVTFSCLSEPVVFIIMLSLSRLSGSLSLSGLFATPSTTLWLTSGAAMVMMTASLFFVILAENCRIPFDDPNTHLELTMIHEVMVLDHSGPAFGMITYSAALKLFLLGAFFLNVVQPLRFANPWLDWLFFSASMVMLAMTIGLVESGMARFRMTRVPQMLLSACVLSAFSMILVLR